MPKFKDNMKENYLKYYFLVELTQLSELLVTSSENYFHLKFSNNYGHFKNEFVFIMSIIDKRLSHQRFFNTSSEDKGSSQFRKRSGSLSSVLMLQERRGQLKKFGGSQWSLSSLTPEEDSPLAKMTPTQTLLLGLYQAFKERDSIFLTTMELLENASSLIEDDVNEDEFDEVKEAPSLSDFLIKLSTVERKHADLIFEWLYSHNGLLTLNNDGLIDNFVQSDEGEEESSKGRKQSLMDGLKGSNISVVLFSLQMFVNQEILQRRASHIAGLLELRASGEKMLASERSQSSSSIKTGLGSGFSQEILTFLKFAVEKFCTEEQDVNKQARNIMMFLETKIKEVNGF